MGVAAAYEILAWPRADLRIENDCRFRERGVRDDLQAVLLEAMRRKDEKGGDVQDATTEPGRNETGGDVSGLARLARYVREGASEAVGVENIFQDASWRDLLHHAESMGGFFGAGTLKACYVDLGESGNSILLADGQDTVISVNTQCRRDPLLRLLSR